MGLQQGLSPPLRHPAAAACPACGCPCCCSAETMLADMGVPLGWRTLAEPVVAGDTRFQVPGDALALGTQGQPELYTYISQLAFNLSL